MIGTLSLAGLRASDVIRPTIAHTITYTIPGVPRRQWMAFMQTIAGRIFVLAMVLLMFCSGAAWAKIDECQPDGMSDVEAARIIAIATDQGQKFRKTIDDLRAQGITYETDTTYENIMADPERALALALERYGGRRIIGVATKYRLDQGDNLDQALMGTLDSWVQKKTTNYFTTIMLDYLQNLILLIGGEATISPFQFKIPPNKFVFALSHFTKSADLNKFRDTINSSKYYLAASYRFTEDWSLFNKDTLFEVGITFTTNPKRDDVTLETILFRGVDILKRDWPLSFRKKDECLKYLK